MCLDDIKEISDVKFVYLFCEDLGTIQRHINHGRNFDYQEGDSGYTYLKQDNKIFAHDEYQSRPNYVFYREQIERISLEILS